MAKILITGFPTMGGSGLVATKLGLKLAERGHDIHFMFYKEPFFLQANDISENVTFHKLERLNYSLFSEIGSPYSIQAASKMTEIIRNNKIDLVHSHYTIPHSLVNYLTSKLTNVKTIVTAHGSDTHTLGHNPGYKPVIQMALKESSCVTSVSKYLANETEMIFELPKDSVKVVYNFIEPNEFKPEDGIRENTIIQASNFRPIKQLPLMIEIFSKISSDFPEWKLKLVGYGPEYPVCVRKARQLGVRDKVEFLGVRKDVPILIANSSVLASTSRIESFGLTIAEGMASGLPIWAPKVGGIPEICIDGKNGYLYDPRDIMDAADKLSMLLSDDEKRKKFGENGRKRIIEKFSPTVVVSEYEKIYENIICC